jgi:hypothetical protein
MFFNEKHIDIYLKIPGNSDRHNKIRIYSVDGYSLFIKSESDDPIEAEQTESGKILILQPLKTKDQRPKTKD